MSATKIVDGFTLLTDPVKIAEIIDVLSRLIDQSFFSNDEKKSVAGVIMRLTSALDSLIITDGMIQSDEKKPTRASSRSKKTQ